MGNVTVFTKTRALAVEDGTVTTGAVNASGRLILTRKNGTTVDAGGVVGPKGDTGAKGDTGIGLVATDLGTLVLDNVKTPGIYTQSTAGNATTANKYPVAAQGVLEVFANSTGNLVYQHYTVYNGGTYAGTLWVRATSAGSTWSAWKCLNAPPLAVSSVCDTTLALTTTQTELSGTPQTITALGTDDVYFVTANIDNQSTGTTATTAQVRLTVDGTAQAAIASWSNGAISGLRGMSSQQWIITGLAAGDHIFRLTGARSGGADSMVRVNSNGTTLVTLRQ